MTESVLELGAPKPRAPLSPLSLLPIAEILDTETSGLWELGQ